MNKDSNYKNLTENKDNSNKIENLKLEAKSKLSNGKYTQHNIHNIKILFSKHYKICLRGEEMVSLRTNIINSLIDIIHHSVREAKINRKTTSKKLREELRNE